MADELGLVPIKIDNLKRIERDQPNLIEYFIDWVLGDGTTSVISKDELAPVRVELLKDAHQMAD